MSQQAPPEGCYCAATRFRKVRGRPADRSAGPPEASGYRIRRLHILPRLMGEGTTSKPLNVTRGKRRRSALLTAGTALLLLLVVLLGCGSDDESDSTGTQDTLPPQVVRDSDINAQPEGSPGRALLEWWQAFQFSDAPQVERLTSEETIEEIGAANLAELVKTRGQGLQGIEVLEASEDGESATVRVGLLTFQPSEPGGPPPEEPTASKPTTITMVSESGAWLYDYPEYLQPMVESLKQAQKAAKENGN